MVVLVAGCLELYHYSDILDAASKWTYSSYDNALRGAGRLILCLHADCLGSA